MRWVKTVGTGFPSKSVRSEKPVESTGGKFRTVSAAQNRRLKKQYLPKGKVPAPQMSELESQLAEVKALFKQRYGEDLDIEVDSDLDEDGMLWIKTEGTGRVTKTTAREEQVEHKTVRVGGKFVTIRSSHHRVLERMYRGDAPPSFDDLEAKLKQVKALYKSKYGKDVDEDLKHRGCVAGLLLWLRGE
jgi:hypothetical protein